MAAIFACTGTSLTTGANNGGWPDAVVSALNAIAPEGFTFSNLGQAGSTSTWGLANIGAVADLQADAVLIEFAMNDAVTSGGVSLAQSESNLRGMITAIKAQRSTTLVLPMTMNPAIGSGKSVRPELTAYYQMYGRVARELGLPILDHYGIWGAPTSAQIPDGIHPTSGAVQPIVVPVVTQALKGFL